MTTPTDTAQLADEIEALAKEATQAPWYTLGPPWLPSDAERRGFAGALEKLRGIMDPVPNSPRP